LKNIISDFSDEILEDFFSSMGVPRNLSDLLIGISDINKNKMKKKERSYYFNDDYYNVFVYETCKYPPNSNPHKTLN
jgi:hypothetical protein